MKVTVRFFPSLRRIVNADEIEVELPEGAGINDLVDLLTHRFGRGFLEALYISDLGVTNPYTSVIIDGETVILTKSKNYKLKDKSVVSFIAPVGGG
jgi:molybdopterin converting factor small subunit